MNTSQASYNDFLRTFAMAFAVAVIFVIALVIIVDPYGLFGLVRQSGFNLVKPGLTRYQDEIKVAQAIGLRPKTIILGNSRAEIGFDPNSPHFLAADTPVYNLAIPGTGLSTSSTQLLSLHRAGVRPKTIIVGLEFLDFLAPEKQRDSAAPVASVAAGNGGINKTLWRFDTLFSLTSVKDSLRTLRIQHDSEATTVTSHGFNPLLEYRAYVRNEGYHALFQQASKAGAKALLKKTPGMLADEDFVYLRRILLDSVEDKANVRLVIYPYHALILAMFEEAEAWQLFDDWKTRVVAEVAAVRLAHPSASITLDDFSGFGEFSCEHIPEKDERNKEPRWYWEAGHFKKELGEYVLQAVLFRKNGFGMTLDQGSIDLNAQRIALERSRCALTYPALFHRVAELMKRTR